MQIQQTDNELIIRETPGCLWIFGLFFGIIGGIFVYGSVGGFTNSNQQDPWILALAFMMGATGVIAGIWIIYGAPITKVIINRIQNTVEITRFGLFGKKITFYDLDEIEQFCLIEERDDENNAIWSLGMNLSNGETFRISSQPSHDELFKRRFVFQTNEFIQKQIAPTVMIFEPEDESGSEMS